MKLYKLSREGGSYDEIQSAVIRAKTEKKARELANSIAGDEGKIWGDPEKVQCEQLKASGDEGIICADFYEA